MKTITNKTTKILGKKDQRMPYGELLSIIANDPGERGLKIDEQKERFRIIDAIEKAGTGDISLEDSDFAKLHNLSKEFKWLMNNRDLVEMGDHLDEVAKQK